MSNQKNNPKQDWGFYACTPRIVRTQYKHLSHTEKWLYVCLKDLCGDRGMCYRTLKVLSEETDLSTGNLSTSIRNLHDAGLIHAEKKRRSNNPTGKEVWHITIVDIWQANVEYCSKNERSQEDVQTMNNNVQILNVPTPQRSKNEAQRSENEAQRSKNEAQRSNFVDRRINNEERTEKESVSPSPETTMQGSTHTPSEINVSSEFAYSLPQGNTEKPIPPNPDKAHVNPLKKERWEDLLDYWDRKYGPGARPDRVIEKAKDMITRMKPTPEQVDKVCAELKARNKPVTFETMYNNWHLLKEVEEREQVKTNPVPKSVSGRKRVQETDPAYAEYLAMMKGGE